MGFANSNDTMSLLGKILGRPLRTGDASAQKVGPITGLPILGLDALGSSSYGPEAALVILTIAGAKGVAWMPWITGAILFLLSILYLSYRQTLSAYPQGGGAYTVAGINLGKHAGLVAAAAVLLDYVLNVAVGISAGVGALISAVPGLQPHVLPLCLAMLLLITLVNLRGIRSSGLIWALPTYCFVIAMSAVLFWGIWKVAGESPHPAAITLVPALGGAAEPVTWWLLIRAFASGCTAMTGVEAVSNAVPIFKGPEVKNARRTLALICFLLGLFLAGTAFLVSAYEIGAMDQKTAGYQSVISQMVAAIGGRGFLYYFTLGSLTGVLILSANTSFAAFPGLCRALAEDGFLPGSFANLGRRLVYTSGICILAFVSGLLLFAFGGITEKLIPLFAVGAFGAFTLSQAGMVAHWRKQGGPAGKTGLRIAINALGMTTTGVALFVLLFAKFLEGAWMAVLIILGLVWILSWMGRHYRRVHREIEAPFELQTSRIAPLRVVVPVEGWNRVTEKALRFALRISEDIVALHVSLGDEEDRIRKTWHDLVETPALQAGYKPPRLHILRSPYRRLYQPLLDAIRDLREEDPDRLIAVVLPELVQPRWWEYLLHNQSAAVLKALLFLQGDGRVVVINTPWYLKEEQK